MKTKTLLLMSLFLLLLQTNIFAQNNGEIIYTNFEPDSIIDLTPMGNDVFFDINNDGQYEIKFSWFFHSAVADILHSISTMSKKNAANINGYHWSRYLFSRNMAYKL